MDTRNALAQQGMQMDQQRNDAYMRQVGVQETAQQNALAEGRRKQVMEWATNAVSSVRQNPALIPQFVAQGKQMGFLSPDVPDNVDMDAVERVAMSLGIAPAPAPVSLSAENVGGFRVLRDSTGKVINSQAPERPQSAGGGAYRDMTPEEVAAVGLPAGTSAQRGPGGKIDVLSKRDNTESLSQKDATVARIKLNQVKVARQQLEAAKKAFAEIRGSFSAGVGGSMLPTEKGRQFDKAVDAMRGSITAINRVPGVGAMSDYETKLDQSKFPSRGEYESVTESQIVGLEQLLDTIDSGYRELIGQPSQSGASGTWGGAAPTGGFTIEEIR
jgi:hypothetical protein